MAPKDKWLEGEEFSAHLDHEPPGNLIRILVKHNHFVVEPVGAPPGWLPPLPTEDITLVDEFIVRLCGMLASNGKWKWRDEEFYALIIGIWLSRLPLSGEEVWAVCQAHGMPDGFKKRIVSGFEFGRGLLVSAQGRAAIKRRRVPAMSTARYEPKRKSKT